MKVGILPSIRTVSTQQGIFLTSQVVIVIYQPGRKLHQRTQKIRRLEFSGIQSCCTHTWVADVLLKLKHQDSVFCVIVMGIVTIVTIARISKLKSEVTLQWWDQNTLLPQVSHEEL